MHIQGATAIVTGSSTGIGQAIANRLVMQVGCVALVGRDYERLSHSKEMICRHGGKAEIFIADLRKEDDINNLVLNIKRSWGEVNIIANIAGTWHDNQNAFYGPHLVDIPPEQINEVLDVNVRAPMLLTRLFLPEMIQKKQGKILNISGTFCGGGAGWLHYYTSKLAVEHFTVGLAEELRQHEIQVNCISPSDVATEALCKFFPQDAKIALHPDKVAELAMFLLTTEIADHITGQVIVIKKNGTGWIQGHSISAYSNDTSNEY